MDEGFSEDFNWNTLKTNRDNAEMVLYVSEQKRIENIVRKAMQDNQADAKFRFSRGISIAKQRVLLEELYKRFPKRVWSEDSDGRYIYNPEKLGIHGTEFGINLL